MNSLMMESPLVLTLVAPVFRLHVGLQEKDLVLEELMQRGAIFSLWCISWMVLSGKVARCSVPLAGRSRRNACRRGTQAEREQPFKARAPGQGHGSLHRIMGEPIQIDSKFLQTNSYSS